MSRALTFALVAETHQDLYRKNAWFRQAVDTFVTLAPILVDGLAAQATEKDAEFQRDVKALERAQVEAPTWLGELL